MRPLNHNFLTNARPTASRRTILAAALGVVPLVGCSNKVRATSDTGFAGGDGSFSVIPVDKRKPAQKLTGIDLEGKPLSSEIWAGKVIVINVWGSWCAPCRHEAPELVAAAKELGDQAQFVGINTRDLDVAPAQAFVRAFQIPYPNFFDPDGTLLLSFPALPPKAIPSTVIIDAQGRVAARILGEAKASTFVAATRDIIAGK